MRPLAIGSAHIWSKRSKMRRAVKEAQELLQIREIRNILSRQTRATCSRFKFH